MFETFPQPPYRDAVASAGGELDAHRSRLMQDRNLGLTSIYNLVHDPNVQSDEGIRRLRDLHVALDIAVRDAYGWGELELAHGFHEVRGQGVRFTFSPEASNRVLELLLELNRERYQAEVSSGLHKRTQTKARARRPVLAGQPSLLGGQMMTNHAGARPPVPTPWELRDDLVARVTADLLGPLDGEHEVIRGYQRDDGTWSSPGRVRDRYLVGMLAPQGTVAVDPERDDDVGPEEGDDAASGGIQDGRSPRPVLAQSSMGLSVVVDGSVHRLIASCSWGQYLREFEDHDDGSRASVWVRTPRQVDVELALEDNEFGPLPVNDERIVLRGRSTRSPMGIRG